MDNEIFFKESKDQSRVKAEIVAKYFWAWAKVVIPTAKRQRIGKIAYIDLFAGPGRYEDGAKSTPLLVLERAVEDPEISRMLVSLFNDRDPESVGALKTVLDSTSEIAGLKHQPQILNNEVGQEIVAQFEKMRLVPTFFFVDPWGYKGLSLRLINSVLKDWGCDCVFFFNYNRINMGLSNNVVRDHMDALFGAIRANELRTRIEGMSPVKREFTIVESISEALKEMGGEYVLPFRFKNEKGRTSHHLIFVSKNFRGYDIMKGVMARESSSAPQGVPSFEYDPTGGSELSLFEPRRPLDELKDSLLRDFDGRQLNMLQIYEEDSAGKLFIKKNYKQALIDLEEQGKISAQPSADDRKKGTFADHVLVQFRDSAQDTDRFDVSHADVG